MTGAHLGLLDTTGSRLTQIRASSVFGKKAQPRLRCKLWEINSDFKGE